MTTKVQLNDEVSENLKRVLKENFTDWIEEDDLKNAFYEEVKLYNEFEQKTKIRKYYNNKVAYFNWLKFFGKIEEDFQSR